MSEGAIEDETVETENDGFVYNFTSATLNENSVNHNQLNGRNIPDNVRKEVDSVVAAVENRVNHANLTAMDSVVIPRDEMAVTSIIGSSGRGPKSRVERFLGIWRTLRS